MAKKYEGSSSILWWIIGIIIVSLTGLFFLVYRSSVVPSDSTASLIKETSTKTNREVVIDCTTDMATQFHIHPELSIFINGQKQEIPAEIGITADCMNAIHTHDNTGVIHVESPEKRDFTLSDFFAVWQKNFSKDQILDSKADDKHIIKETVNGQEVQDFENTILRDKDQIVISYEEK